MLSRRGLLRAGLATSALTVVPGVARATGTDLAELEAAHGARLGVWGRNTRTGRTVEYRAGERFPMCSTFKTVAAGAVLRDRFSPLDRVIHYPPSDLVPNSPITGEHVDTGLSIGDICAAAIQYSDNTAGNLMLRQIGGPPGLTGFFRAIGDQTSRLDRWETELNTAIPGDPRDTTTPAALGRDYERLTLGDALSHPDRERLVTWLKGNTTSAARFHKGLPATWTIADKTGTGDYATAHDIGVVWTGHGTPLVLAVLTTKSTKDAPADDDLIAEAARLAANTLAPGE